MKNKNLFVYFGIGFLVTGLLIGGYFGLIYNPYKFSGDGPIKIAYINSMHFEGFALTMNNFAAFKEVFDKEGIDIEVRRVDMDLLRDPSEESINAKATEAKALIDEWEPDLIYATDDAAQEHVASYYLDGEIPIVFSGVNEDVEKYGYNDADNVAGVLERVHFAETINFAREFYPYIKKVGIIANDYPLWKTVIGRIRAGENVPSDLELVGLDITPTYEEWQNKILDYQDKVDALVMFGVQGTHYHNGTLVNPQNMYKWLIDNNHLPEITFWNFQVAGGNLLSVDVSSREQGRDAGTIAKSILINGELPSDLEIKPTRNGESFFNLARAKKLGLEENEISSVALINSEVYEEFSWKG